MVSQIDVRSDPASSTTPLRIYNPVQKDYATFWETSEHSNGTRTLGEVELAPGGGNTPHYHRTFSEHFQVLEGELDVLLGKTTHRLKAGESATVPAGTLHCFSNPTRQTTRFMVEIRPGHTGFEQALQIIYGLASDGKTNAKGIPTNFYHLAVVGQLSDTTLPGLMDLLAPVFRWLYKQAQAKGIEQELIERYCR